MMDDNLSKFGGKVSAKFVWHVDNKTVENFGLLIYYGKFSTFSYLALFTIMY
jgi:hypothetical protein